MECLPGEPLMSRDNVDSMRVPNVASGHLPGLADLGIQATALEAVAAGPTSGRLSTAGATTAGAPAPAASRRRPRPQAGAGIEEGFVMQLVIGNKNYSSCVDAAGV